MASSNDIQAAGTDCLNWNCGDASASLRQLLEYVETEALKAIGWYLGHKRTKSRYSRWIQFLAVTLTAAAGIAPLAQPILKIPLSPFWPTLLVGLAAALLGLDKAFGFSSGWARYVMAAANIQKSLEEFRMDWAVLIAKACPAPSADQLEALLQRAKEFRVNVQGIVIQETKDWVTEFQSNLSQMEKDVSAQLATLKAQAEKAAQDKAAAKALGSIKLTVPNAASTDGAKIQVTLGDGAGTVADESVTGSQTWARLNLAAGQYQIAVSATAGGKPVSATAPVIVKPGEIAAVQISLPI